MNVFPSRQIFSPALRLTFFMCSFLCISLSGGLNSASAALATDANKALPFFLNKESLFASGQVSRSILDANILKTEIESQILVQWSDKQYTLDAQQLLREIQMAKYVETIEPTYLYSSNRLSSLTVQKIPQGTQLQILETDAFWAKALYPAQKKIGWIPLHQIKARHDDPGIYTNVTEVKIYSQPDLKSKTLGTLRRLSRVSPQSASTQFLKATHEGKTVYFDIGFFLNKSDFSNWAYHPTHGWVTIESRNRNFIQTKNKQTIPTAELMGFVTNPTRGIVIRPIASHYGPQLLSRVQVIKPDANIWAQSNISGHGLVWWKKEELIKPRNPELKSNTLSTEEMLKKNIYSIAFENKKSVRGVLSADGIYRTDDGLNWTKITLFKNQNYPVSIHPNGTWIVGSYKSNNQGKSFEPFIRWDQLAEAIERSQGKVAKILKLTRIESLPNSQIRIHVDTGVKKVTLESRLDNIYWK